MRDMRVTRRGFGKMAGTGMLALASGVSFTLTGCGVFDDILTWIPIGITAITGIVTVLGALVPPEGLVIINIVKAAFADLAATVTQYKNDTNPADKATLIAKIRTLLVDIVANFQSFLDQLNIGNSPIEAIVIGLANVVLSALAGFLGELPATGTRMLSGTFHVGHSAPHTYSTHLYKRVKDFKSAYNAVCASHNHPEIEIQ